MKFIQAALCAFVLFATSLGYSVVINVNYQDDNEGFDSDTVRDGVALGVLRKAAFERAVSVWEKQLAGNVNIRVIAQFVEYKVPETDPPEDEFVTLGENIVLGRHANIPPLLTATVYISSLASQLVGMQLSDGSGFQILIQFNENIDKLAAGAGRFHYGLDGDVPAGEYEFLGVAIHELGHGLGFIEEIDLTSGDYPNSIHSPMIFGRFLVRRGTANEFFPDMTDPERLLAVSSGEVYFSGPSTIAAAVPNPDFIPDLINPPVNNNSEVKIFTTAGEEIGSAVSHWDPAHKIDFEVQLLMEHNNPTGATNLSVDYTREVMEDLGWELLPVPEVEITPDKLLFDTTDIASGPSDPLTITVANTGSADLEIINVKVMSIGGAEDATQFQVVAGGAPGVLPMGQNREVQVVFDPDTALASPTLASLMVFTSDTHEYRQRVALEGQSFGAGGGAAEVWVDGSFAGVETGAQESPFNTIGEGVDFALAQGIVHIAPGVYLESLFADAVTLLNDDALSGVVRIEAPLARK